MADHTNNQYQFPPAPPPPPQQPPQHQPHPQSRSGKAAMAFARFTQPFGIGGIAGSRPPSSSGTGTPGAGGNAPRSTSATVAANTRLTSRTTELGLDSPIQAISANQDCDRLVVAGRDFLKIIVVTDDTLSESTQSLRAQNSNRRGFIQNEVKWGNHPVRDLIATAATNGSIALYRDFRHDRILQEHHRQVNRLAFNAADGRLFLSASQDGSVKLWDLRERKSRITFVGKSEAVRDVQFNEANAVEFVAGYENGCVQRWDYRNPSVCERKISNAHQGPVYSVAWHPDGKHCASGGRDKTVKVWDFYADPRRKSKHTVFTQTSLGRVVWRPGGLRTTELATCSIGNDYRIHGWDLRRPYMPSWVLMEHGNAITGLQFRDEDVLWSGGKDCLLVQHDVCFGHAPIGDLPMVAFAWNAENEFTFATQRRKRNESTGGPRGGSSSDSGSGGGGRSG
ncbi:WD40 repeat-like protein, partial [Terfezia boudieri ATCC MYA-4762]